MQPKPVVPGCGSSPLRTLHASTRVILATIPQANVLLCAPLTDGKRRFGDIQRTVQGHSRTCWSQDAKSGMWDVEHPYLRRQDRQPLCRDNTPPTSSPRCVFTHVGSARSEFWKDVLRSIGAFLQGQTRGRQTLFLTLFRHGAYINFINRTQP